jgi:hypothetical protein
VPGVRRKAFVPLHQPNTLTFSEIDKLLKRELGARRLPDEEVPTKEPAKKRTREEQEEEDMGLFDAFIEDGIDIENVPLDPFKYDDGTYLCTFVGVELREVKDNEKFDMSLNFKYQIVGTQPEGMYPGKPISTDGKFLPSKKFVAEDKAKAEEFLGYAMQRIKNLGIEVPHKADVSSINELKGIRVLVTLKTAKPKNEGDEPRQFVNSVKLAADVDEDIDDLFKE